MQRGKVIKAVGLSVLAISFVYLFSRVDQSLPGEISVFLRAYPAAFSGAVLMYSAGLVSVALAWLLLFDMGRTARDFLACGWIYAYANIVKYLPGNVFHFGARQVLMLRVGASHSETAAASLREVLFLPFSAVLLCACLLSIRQLLFADSGSLQPGAGEVALYLAFLFVSALAFILIPLTRTSVLILLLYLLFHLLAVAGFFLLLQTETELFLAATFLLISWVIGFCTPGAPGGLGVREAAFVYMASEMTRLMPAETAAVYATLFRLVTMAGDIALVVLMWVLNMVNKSRSVEP